MREDWIDWRRDIIVVLRHESCTKGRDGGICGHCRNAAEQMVEHNPGLSIKNAESML